MGLFKNLSRVGDFVDKGLDLADQAVTDKDKLNDLKYTLEKARAELLLGGRGQSITKITICFLVSLIVGSLWYAFMFNQELLRQATTFSNAASQYVLYLIGGYAGGTIAKRFIEKR